ncbi:alpha amylase C-terminal domain-containing protein [Azotobacter sp. CWF10]
MGSRRRSARHADAPAGRSLQCGTLGESGAQGRLLWVSHEDHANQVFAFLRRLDGNLVLTVVNLGDSSFSGHSYDVRVSGEMGQWTQLLCTQDAAFGGWDGAGNAFYEPWTQPEGRLYINLPQWSVVMLRRK